MSYVELLDLAHPSPTERHPAAPRLRFGGEDEMASLKPVLDQLDYGIVLFDGVDVVHVNRAARSELRQAGSPLRLAGMRLVAHDVAESAAIQQALRDASHRARRRLFTLRAPERVLPVAIAPLASCGNGLGASCTAMLVMGRRSVCPQLTAQWFCTLHHLTPAESGVLAALLAGRMPSAIARDNGVAISTVRSHLASIKQKTAIRCLRDLVLAAATLPPLVPLLAEA